MSTKPKKNVIHLEQRPAPPDTLTERASAFWRQVVDSLPANYLRPADLPLLGAYCLACDRWLEAERIIADEGLIVGNRPHPALAISDQQAKQMMALAVSCACARQAGFVPTLPTCDGHMKARPHRRRWARPDSSLDRAASPAWGHNWGHIENHEIADHCAAIVFSVCSMKARGTKHLRLSSRKALFISTTIFARVRH